MKKRANAARLNNLCQRLKKKLGRRWDEAEDEHRRKAQRKSFKQSSNTRWSGDDRILVFQEAANEFLKGTKVWQLIPESARVVVLDSRLSIQQVIDALVSESQQNCAPVWDSKIQKYSGVATWQSLISALITSGSNLKDFLSRKIGTINLDKMLRVHPKHPLKEAIQASMTSEPRTFCVIGGTCSGGLETGDIMNVFTRQRILRFLFGQLSAHAAGENHSYNSVEASTTPSLSGERKSGTNTDLVKKNLFDEILMFTVEQLGIVSRDGVKTVTAGQACLKEVLVKLVKQNLGRVVVLDNDGRAIEMYSRSDIRIMSDEVLSILDLDVVEAARKHPRLCTFCSRTDTLQVVMAKMAKGAATAGEVLVCVGPDRRYEGLVSFTSLFGILDNTKQDAASQGKSIPSTGGSSFQPKSSETGSSEMETTVDNTNTNSNNNNNSSSAVKSHTSTMQMDSH